MMKNNNLIDAIAPRLAELMIRKIETLQTDWHKPWIADMTQGLPRNLRGTPYRAGNVLTLMFLSELEGYRTPLFMTFKQAKEEGLNIRKGFASFPVYFWKMLFRHKETHRSIDPEQYHKLSTAEKKNYAVIPMMRYYTVFNIDQTDMAEKQPERYAKLTEKVEPKDYSDGMLCEPLDRLLERQDWVCHIDLKYSSRAFFTPALDRIVCPLKTQFPSGAAFYGTLLHEMAHSTGTDERLGRKFGTRFGDAQYAREELVAEFTAALAGAMLGFATMPRDENAAYLKHWLQKLEAEPTYLFDILSEVNKAARMIDEHLKNAEETASNEKPAEAA